MTVVAPSLLRVQAKQKSAQQTAQIRCQFIKFISPLSRDARERNPLIAAHFIVMKAADRCNIFQCGVSRPPDYFLDMPRRARYWLRRTTL
jgi:hypothetical protein